MGRRNDIAKASASRARATTDDAERWRGTSTTDSWVTARRAFGEEELEIGHPRSPCGAGSSAVSSDDNRCGMPLRAVRRSPIGSCGHGVVTGTARCGLVGTVTVPSSARRWRHGAQVVRATASGRASHTSVRKRDGTDRVFFAAPQTWHDRSMALRARVKAT